VVIAVAARNARRMSRGFACSIDTSDTVRDRHLLLYNITWTNNGGYWGDVTPDLGADPYCVYITTNDYDLLLHISAGSNLDLGQEGHLLVSPVERIEFTPRSTRATRPSLLASARPR